MEAIVSLLQGAGCPPTHAVMFYELFISQLLAYAPWDGAKKFLSDEQRKQDIARWKEINIKFPSEDYPAIAENAALIGDLPGLAT